MKNLTNPLKILSVGKIIKKSFLAWHKYPLSGLAILSYMLAKRVEAKNIKTIVKAKHLGIDNEFIEKKLVVLA